VGGRQEDEAPSDAHDECQSVYAGEAPKCMQRSGRHQQRSKAASSFVNDAVQFVLTRYSEQRDARRPEIA
jgi:hypothetical protein